MRYQSASLLTRDGVFSTLDPYSLFRFFPVYLPNTSPNSILDEFFPYQGYLDKS